MLTSVLFFVTLIASSKSQNSLFDANYVKLTITTAGTYKDNYEGFYFKDSDPEVLCAYGSPNTAFAGTAADTFFYKLLNKNAWLYGDATAITDQGVDDPVNGYNQRVVLTTVDPSIGNNCNTSFNTGNYELYANVIYAHRDAWDLLDQFWCTTTDPITSCTVNVTVCKYGDTPECDTGSPSKSPTTSQPSKSPTKNPTPAPTAPRVKYKLYQELPTAGCPPCDPFTLSIGLFIWIDPHGQSYARITLTGPNDRAFMVLFSQGDYDPDPGNEGYGFADWKSNYFLNNLYTQNGALPGYIVDPLLEEGGEVVIGDRGTSIDYSNWATAYTPQNSEIVEFDKNYKPGTVLVTFTRAITTPDPEDWQFQFTELLDDFYLYATIAKGAVNTFDSNDHVMALINKEPIDLNNGFEDIKGNYGIRGKFESDTSHPLSPPEFTIFFEYDPFLFTYSGYVIKPKDTWLLWGLYNEANETKAIEDGNVWNYAILCTLGGEVEFTDLHTMAGLNTAFDKSGTWTHGIDDYGSTHRINFTFIDDGPIDYNQLDFDSALTGWDTVKFLTTREIIFNIFYGDNDKDITEDQTAQDDKYYGSVMVYLDYVTYAPTLAPTMAPSLAPSIAPSLAPSINPTPAPTVSPTNLPTRNPIEQATPTQTPSKLPTFSPTKLPTSATSSTTSSQPTNSPSHVPTEGPTKKPTYSPTISSISPTGVPSSAPTKCIDDTSLTNLDCPDDSCNEKPYLDFTVSFSVCKNKPFVGNRYGLWNGIADCLCDLSENGKYFDYSNPLNNKRRLKRDNTECNLNIIQYDMSSLTEPVDVNCNTTGFRFEFTVERCSDCITITQALNRVNEMEKSEVYKAITQCSNWFSKQVDNIGFDGVYDIQYDVNEEFGIKCDVEQTGGVNSNIYNAFIVIIIATLLSAVLV